MKAFLGALVLTLLAAATGILAATELHRLNSDTKLVIPTEQANQLDEVIELVDAPLRQRVKHLHQDLTRHDSTPSGRI